MICPKVLFLNCFRGVYLSTLHINLWLRQHISHIGERWRGGILTLSPHAPDQLKKSKQIVKHIKNIWIFLSTNIYTNVDKHAKFYDEITFVVACTEITKSLLYFFFLKSHFGHWFYYFCTRHKNIISSRNFAPMLKFCICLLIFFFRFS